MQKKRWFPVIYMFVITAVFSSVIIAFSQFTKDRVLANQQRGFELAVLAVLPGMYDPELSSLELHRRFIEDIDKDSSGQAYILKKNGRLTAYALPIAGQGFWAPIKGVIGIAADKKTILGAVFYEQKETPGLGAQITTNQFRNQFNGRVISMGDKALTFKRQGEVLGKSDLYAVTGATQTTVRLEKIINDAIGDWLAKSSEEEN